MIEPFRIAVDQAVLDDLALRLKAFRPPPSPEDRGWEDGTDLGYLAELIDYWRDKYDWRVHEAALNRFAQFTAQVAGTRLHFVHEKGQGPTPLPLLLAHGWPDGFQRFVKLIPLLTDPSSHGAEAVDAFDVVAPSLPGYGFSPRLAQGTARAQFGSLFHTLMTEKLGYDRYGAHGGDVGSAVCDQLRRNHAAVVGVHLTNVPMLHTQPPRDVTADERDYLTRMDRFRIEGGG